MVLGKFPVPGRPTIARLVDVRRSGENYGVHYNLSNAIAFGKTSSCWSAPKSS